MDIGSYITLDNVEAVVYVNGEKHVVRDLMAYSKSGADLDTDLVVLDCDKDRVRQEVLDKSAYEVMIEK